MFRNQHTHTHTSYTKHRILRLSLETSKIRENMIISCWKYRAFNWQTTQNDNNYNWHGFRLIQLKIVWHGFLAFEKFYVLFFFFNLTRELKRGCLLSWEKVNIINIRLLVNQELTFVGCVIISLKMSCSPQVSPTERVDLRIQMPQLRKPL